MQSREAAKVARAQYRAGMAAIYADMEKKNEERLKTCPRCACGREADQITGLCVVAETLGHCGK